MTEWAIALLIAVAVFVASLPTTLPRWQRLSVTAAVLILATAAFSMLLVA